MNLFNEYLKDVGEGIEQTIPRVQVKFRKQLCFKGTKIDYDKFTYFVLRDGKYLPLFTVSDIRDTDRVINMYPLLCVGMAELLSFSSNTGDSIATNFYNDINVNQDVLSTEADLLNFVNLFQSANLKENDNEFEILFALRSDYTSCIFNTVKQLVSIMSCCYFTNTKLFCEALLESMKFAYTYCSAFTVDLNKIANIQISDNTTKSFQVKNIVTLSSLRPKRIGYTIPNSKTKHYISNCRGLGIYAYLILLFSVYEKFGEALSSRIADIKVNDEKVKNFIQSQFVKCIGDDFVGKYYKSGRKSVRLCEKSLAYPTLFQGGIPVNSGIVYTNEDGKKITRDVYENEILWKRANHVVFSKISDGLFIRNAETYYTTPNSLIGAAFICYCDNYKFSDDIKRFECLSEEHITELIHKEATSQLGYVKEIESLKKSHNAELLKISEEHKDYCEAYDKKIEELNAIIASKSNIIEQLKSELKDKRDYIKGYYSDEEITFNEDLNLSISDMVSYINQFKITMVGGRMDLLAKLEEQGLSGVVQVDSENMLTGTPINSDFFCINTKFISHKVVHNVESRYKDQKSQMFYFNGTNIESLIKACYNFITEWVGE